MNSKLTPAEQLEQRVFSALETYSNVHRGSGHKSKLSTHLYEKARKVVLDHLKLSSSYVVVFTSPRRSKLMTNQLEPKAYKSIRSIDLGLKLGIHALAIQKSKIADVKIHDEGGGTARLVSPDWVVQGKAPDSFEAGTPAIVNVIALAVALQLIDKYGKDCFQKYQHRNVSPLEEDDYPKLNGKELLVELRKTIVGRDQSVPTSQGTSRFINLDNSASTPALLAVWQAFAGSVGLTDSKLGVEKVRSICTEFLNANKSNYEVLFTCNTTESINVVAQNYNWNKEADLEPVIVSSLLEHSSNDLPWRLVAGTKIKRLNFDENGFFDVTQLEEMLIKYNKEQIHGKQRIKLLAINGASNVMGVSNDIKSIVSLAHKYGAEVLIDAAQLVAHNRIDLDELGADFLVFSAHKIYAPFGAGVLVSRKGLLDLNNETKASFAMCDEENAAGIIALGKSLQLLQKVSMEIVHAEEVQLTRYALKQLSTVKGMKLRGISSEQDARFEDKLGVFPFDLGNKIPFGVAKELAYRNGIGVRVGCHCAHILVKKIVGVGPGLEKFQRFIQQFSKHTIFPGVIRVSLGIENTKEDIDQLVNALKEISGEKSSEKLDKSKMKNSMNEYINDRKKLVIN